MAGSLVWNHLAKRDELEKADLIMGFGHFDIRVPQHCAALYKEGRAPKIVFTGGVGSGSAGLSQPEAEFFKEEALRLGVPLCDIIVEAASTNTPDNVRCSMEVLVNLGYDEVEVRKSRVILVATPYRQRRVHLTCRKHLPDARLQNSPPISDYTTDQAIFSTKGQHLDLLLAGEVDRILLYGAKGDIQHEHLPSEIQEAAAVAAAAVAALPPSTTE
ncbi:unnamed protein product [Symbiodinium natans]|uniref:DUF218 domain-containing protein n=1 Tax=Symbiodinium natans TaxID=878477 RepID=A0A812M1A0_9DINO|nr:unnamed protein product [Symbiodinium natans]